MHTFCYQFFNFYSSLYFRESEGSFAIAEVFISSFTLTYLCVFTREVWPSSFDVIDTSTPYLMRFVPKLCLPECQLIFFSIPALLTKIFNHFWQLAWDGSLNTFSLEVPRSGNNPTPSLLNGISRGILVLA